MSGFGSGGFGSGFGQSSNQQTSGFGGFGSNTNNPSGFGTNNTNTFGANTTNTGGSLFGNTNTTGGGFGSATGTGTFGSASNTGFGANKPTFGTGNTSGGNGLFGSSTTNTGTSGFGGSFGNTANTTTSSPFGGAGGLFGGNKPAFGAATTTGTSSLFGGTTAGGFGSSTTGAFGSSNVPSIGATVGDPPGTGVAQFTAHNEKEPNNSSQSNSFQSILFQDPYKKWSSEELRLVDYAQGRKHGNASGTGAFGVSSFGSAFGANNNASQPSGFGNNTSGGGLFGSANNNNNTTTSAFGQPSAGTGFGGGATGGGLFGSKPAATAGGLFGSTTQPAQTGGGLFGSSTGGFGGTSNTGTGFGSNTAATGTGLFGSAANATQNKPAGGFSFGQSSTATPGFGTAGATGGFGAPAGGASTGGGLFNTAQPAAGGGLFGGGSQPQATASSGFGSGFGAQNQTSSSLFGNNAQQKPAGTLFGGSTNTTGGGGLFGNTQASSAPFGAQNTATATGGLFGSKPATTGTNLFGGSMTGQAPGTTGGLFGNLGANAQAQQPAQPSLFSSLGQTQQKPSIFGGPTQPATGGGLFGSSTNQQQPSLFGGANPQQLGQGSLLGSSILGNNQMASQTPQSLTTSIADVSAYGAASLFGNLGANEAQNPGPLATPLGNKSKPRRSSILPMYKLNPASSSRFMTPQKRGFGFSYSTYGTPGSPSSVSSTPGGFNRGLLGASSGGRGLSKSVSTSSLRRSFNTEDSILAPGAFSASSGARFYGSNGSVKKLVINRDMRSDLFVTPTKERQAIEAPSGSRKLSKKVSFDTSTAEGATLASEDAEPSTPAGDVNESRASGSRTANGSKAASTSSTANGDQGKSKELAIVHEEDASTQATTSKSSDKAPGAYWMRPSRKEIESKSRAELQRISNLVVGRENVGSVAFKDPVDLSNINLDELFGGFVNLQTRSATVYPDPSKKPPVGKGLNVPSRISLEQSWPRVRDKRSTGDAKRLAKHIDRLKRIENTSFESYDDDTGVWIFSVPHFTTYGLDYDDDETDAEGQDAREVERTPTQLRVEEDTGSFNQRDLDDTFAFRQQNMKLPGAFDQDMLADDGEDQEMAEIPAQTNLSARWRVDSPEGTRGSARHLMDFGEGSEDEIAESSPAAEHDDLEQGSGNGSDAITQSEIPGGILRARNRALREIGGLSAVVPSEAAPWRESIKKSLGNRASAVREDSANDTDSLGSPEHVGLESRGFLTSMDLMKSIFGNGGRVAYGADASVRPLGFVKLPLDEDEPDMDDNATAGDRNGGSAGRLDDAADMLTVQQGGVRAGDEPIPFGKYPSKSSAGLLGSQMQSTDIELFDGIPAARLQQVPAESLFHGRDQRDPGSTHEKQVWQLVSILFDDIAVNNGETVASIRKARLSAFWEDLVGDATTKAMSAAMTPEDKALAALGGRKKIEACASLTEGRDFRAATLVSLIGSSDDFRREMRTQLRQWRQDSVLAEFSEPMRAIYELLGGNVCVSEGKKDGAVEDRMDSFVISRRFGLDWRQAFGLRLWYATSSQDDVSEAIKMFAEDITQDKEARPSPWYVEQGIKPLHEDDQSDSREDILWGLLKLYAGMQSAAESVAIPATYQPSPVEFRLPWQLMQVLARRLPDTQVLKELSDKLTLSYASQLTAEGSWYKAAWVLVHLHDTTTKASELRDLITRNWGLNGALEGDSDVPDEPGTSAGAHTGAIFRKLCIPSSWVYEAMALWYHDQAERASTADARQQLKMLEFYSLWLDESKREEAYRLFAQDIGPACYIRRARDLDLLLARLPASFVQTAGCRAAVADIRLSAGKPNRSDGDRAAARAGLGRIRV